MFLGTVVHVLGKAGVGGWGLQLLITRLQWLDYLITFNQTLGRAGHAEYEELGTKHCLCKVWVLLSSKQGLPGGRGTIFSAVTRDWFLIFTVNCTLCFLWREEEIFQITVLVQCCRFVPTASVFSVLCLVRLWSLERWRFMVGMGKGWQREGGLIEVAHKPNCCGWTSQVRELCWKLSVHLKFSRVVSNRSKSAYWKHKVISWECWGGYKHRLT